jgi:hypothetical protein
MPSPDAYTLRARVTPVLVVCLPPLVLLGAGVISGTRLGIATGLTVTVLGALAGQLGRDRGKVLEPDLWRGWGGSPTLQALRMRGAVDPDEAERQHQRLAILVEEPLPTLEQECADPDAADRCYNGVTRRLIGLTRDNDEFPLVLAENINYGQRRNLLGLRAFGIGAALLTLIAALVLFATVRGNISTRLGEFGPGAVTGVLELVFWGAVVSSDWVRIPGNAYAARLLEAAEMLARNERPRCADGGR